jgi:hypothetical protein
MISPTTSAALPIPYYDNLEYPLSLCNATTTGNATTNSSSGDHIPITSLEPDGTVQHHKSAILSMKAFLHTLRRRKFINSANNNTNDDNTNDINNELPRPFRGRKSNISNYCSIIIIIIIIYSLVQRSVINVRNY